MDKSKRELMVRSLKGLWVGDCIGNIGQLYYAHDILKALDEGMVKFGGDNINPMAQHFQLSDDTEEAIVLVNHLDNFGQIRQDFFARELARRYYTRDPDGEIYGYGLMTRKVLKEIYEGKSWTEANQTKPKIEGPSFVDKLISQAAQGKSLNDAMAEVNADIQIALKNEPNMKVGSCGNGSAMRVAPLGAFILGQCIEKAFDPITCCKEQATLQSEVTHCHPEGIAGSIAVTLLSYLIANDYVFKCNNKTPVMYYEPLLKHTPQGKVWDGIKRASELPLDTPLTKLIEVLGNGTHVTCMDTVPLCIFLTIRAVTQYKVEEMYEKVIIETCKCFGDVDTNCAIVGGMIGIISPPPEKWERYCQPMEGLLGEELPPAKIRVIPTEVNKNAIIEAMKETKPWMSEPYTEEQIDAKNTWYKSVDDKGDISFSKETVKEPSKIPSFEDILKKRVEELQ